MRSIGWSLNEGLKKPNKYVTKKGTRVFLLRSTYLIIVLLLLLFGLCTWALRFRAWARREIKTLRTALFNAMAALRE